MTVDRWTYVEEFDKLSPFTDGMIERGIEENRKGIFVVRVLDENNQPVENAEVKVTLSNHEFKFGANSFMLGMYDTEEENKLWEEKYAKILNYTVSPLYWNSLEPEPGKLRFSEDSKKIWRRPLKGNRRCLRQRFLRP